MYAGGYPLYENFRDLCLPGDFHAMFESAPGRYTFEVHNGVSVFLKGSLLPCSCPRLQH